MKIFSKYKYFYDVFEIKFKCYIFILCMPVLIPGAPSWSSGSVLDHISLPPVFESRCGHI